MKTDVFPAYVDIFLPIYNPGRSIPGITNSSIPDPGIEKRDPGLQYLHGLTQLLSHSSYTTSVFVLLDIRGWLPLFKRRQHSRLTVFHKALNNLSAFSLDHISVSSRHTRASNENCVIASSY